MSDAAPRRRRKMAAALRYGEADNAPRVVASGQGHYAEEIMELAREHQVPVHADPQLAELLAALDVGASIPEELYLIVAEILIFVHEVDKGYRLADSWREIDPQANNLPKQIGISKPK